MSTAIRGKNAFTLDVVCLGAVAADVLIHPVDSLPRHTPTQLVDTIKLHIGGCAANTAICLARLGCQVGIVAKVGQDEFGDFVLKTLEGEGIDCSQVSRSKKANTSGTVVLVQRGGNRRFIHSIGSNGELRARDVDLDYIRQARILHVAGTLLMPRLDGVPLANVLKLARRAGLLTSLDTVWDSTGRWMSVLAPCLKGLDCFLPSIKEAKMLCRKDQPGAIARVLQRHGVRQIALKMGPRGCYIREKGFYELVPALPVRVVDSTGAGDAFAGGFLKGKLLDWGLAQCARLGNAAGALATTAVGATGGLKSYRETLRFFQKSSTTVT